MKGFNVKMTHVNVSVYIDLDTDITSATLWIISFKQSDINIHLDTDITSATLWIISHKQSDIIIPISSDSTNLTTQCQTAERK